MASRKAAALVPQQQQKKQPPAPRAGAAMLGKQKLATGAHGKSRRALGDIGNLVEVINLEEGKVQHITRPITRKFGAQLRANAQAAADANRNLQKLPLDAAVPRGGDRVEKKVAANVPKNQGLIIEISPDTDDKARNASEVSRVASCSKSSRKIVHTLTSVLTARSKTACGIADRPKELVHDIDAKDADNQLAVVDYIEDIYKFYKVMEHSNLPHDYMDSQREVNANMRAILADWLIEVHHKFELMPETLYLAFNIIDRYLAKEIVLRKEVQLVGVSAMLIASKYEEIWAPEVTDFICISDKAYSREQILGKEKAILNKLEWNLTVPTPYMFLVRFLKAALCDEEMEHMAFFFAEMSLVQYSLITYCPSMIAASAVYAARCTLKKSPLWTSTLKLHTGYPEEQLFNCTKVLISSHSSVPVSKQKFVYKKYSTEQFRSVALHPPATPLLDELSRLQGVTQNK